MSLIFIPRAANICDSCGWNKDVIKKIHKDLGNILESWDDDSSMSADRAKVIAYNAICGLEELVGFTSLDVADYCCISRDEYIEIMGEEDYA